MAKELSKKELDKRIAELKEIYSDVDKLFVTPDGYGFLKENDAKNHAREAKLKVQTVVVNEPEPEEEMTAEEANVILKDLELNDATDWELLKQLADVLGWEVKNNKKSHLEAATAAKAELTKGGE